MAAPMEEESSDISADIQAILHENPSLRVFKSGKKIKCSLSGHEMPCRIDAINTYISGKKYKKVLKKTGGALDWKKFQQHLVSSTKKKHEHQLFCNLTWRHLNRQPHHIQRHVQGRRFQKALAKWEECQLSGEVFKPRGGQKHKKPDSDMEVSDSGTKESWDMEEGGSESEPDSLDDLYPAADFEEESDSEDEEEASAPAAETEKMDTDEEDTDAQTAAPSSSSKRKHKNPGGSEQKKQKSKSSKKSKKQEK